MTRPSDTMKTARAEACLRQILCTASAGQVSLATAAVLINGVFDRERLLTALREIKAKAIEAEVLLRSIPAREVSSS